MSRRRARARRRRGQGTPIVGLRHEIENELALQREINAIGLRRVELLVALHDDLVGTEGITEYGAFEAYLESLGADDMDRLAPRIAAYARSGDEFLAATDRLRARYEER